MIITRTPLRISFAGGGTDLSAFYEHEPGAVFSATITACMYLSVTHKFAGDVRLSYSRTENVSRVKDLEHDIARETLAYCGIDRAVEAVSVCDVPAGTGLGSSSAYTVGLLNALYAYRQQQSDPEELARNACEIEIDKCGHPIGKQDQYASAYGGLRLYEFFADGVKAYPTQDAPELERHLMLFYTGRTRDGNGLLKEQAQAAKQQRSVMREMAQNARTMARCADDVKTFALIMDASWNLKRRLVPYDEDVAEMMGTARRHGATAAKLCGAGGAGFLLLLVPPDRQDEVRACLNVRPHRELRFRFEPRGSQVVYATH